MIACQVLPRLIWPKSFFIGDVFFIGDDFATPAYTAALEERSAKLEVDHDLIILGTLLWKRMPHPLALGMRLVKMLLHFELG